MYDNVEKCCFFGGDGVLFKRIICLTLCTVILFIGVGVSTRRTLAATMAQVTGYTVNIRPDASTKGEPLTQTSSTEWVTVTVLDTKQGIDNAYTWYKVSYNGYVGYIRGDYIRILPDTSAPPSNLPSFDEQMAAFPEDYRVHLRKLHEIYPNWVFLADRLPMSYEEAVNGETANWKTKLVNYDSDGVSWRSLASGAYNWNDGSWNKESGNWVTASREVVMYYMDIRNFLNKDDIYMFLKQGYSTAETEAGVAQIVSGTFLANGYNDPDDTAYGGSYIKVIMEAARRSGVSAYVLAATLRLEQGSGNSDLISGTTSYGKYFNFFNIQASGDDVVGNGLRHAQEKNWTTRSASIIGGAEFYAKGYITSGQDTYFYKDFDLLNAPYYGHQYAQSIYDQLSSGRLIKKTHENNYTAPLVFRIPVYTSMPQTVAEKPAETSARNNYYLLSATNIPNFSMYNFSYSFAVAGDTVIDVGLHGGATVITPQKNTLQAGVNIINITVKAETGYTRTYTLNVTASAPCVLTIPQGTAEGDGGGTVISPSAVKKGDTNGDGKITIVDLANVQKHLLSILVLTGNGFSGADTNGDGNITIIDLANVQKHLLGIITLN